MIKIKSILDLNVKHQIYLFYLIPLLFLIGRAPIDIVLTYIGLNFFFHRILYENDYSIFKNKIFQIDLFFCCIQIIVSLFSTNFSVSILKSISYLRFVLFFCSNKLFKKNQYF